MPPEILDSEDEDDLVAVKAPSPVATRTSGGNAPLDQEVRMDVLVDSALSPSTAEQLRRAHLDLMAPTQDQLPVANFSDLAATSAATSPSSANRKRPLVDSDPEPRSSGKLKRIKIVSKLSSQDLPSEPDLPTPIPPYHATSDTIPGPTLPSLTALDGLADIRTPETRTRKSSQQHSSSADQQTSLTPWSVSAVGSSGRVNSDDAAIGLPKEMDKPRPSRSRSAQIDTANYDYTIIPEKAVKKTRPKRSITDTADAVTSTPMFPENPVLQAPEFERLSPPPESSGLGESIHVTAPAADESTQEPPPSSRPQKAPKKAPKAKQPAKRGRPKKKAVIKDEDEQDELAMEDDVSVATSKTPKSASKTEVQVVIPRMDDILAGLGHRSRRPTPQPAPEQSPAPELPRTDKALEFEANESEADPEEEAEESEEEVVKPKAKAKAKTKVNPEVKAKVNSEAKSKVKSEPSPKAETPKPADISKPPPDAAATATPTLKPNKPAPKTSSAKPSWQQATYRVGLSKTQRIPSLLKVFKK